MESNDSPEIPDRGGRRRQHPRPPFGFFFLDLTDMQTVEKEIASLTEETEVSTESLQASAGTVRHLIPVIRIEIKQGDVPLLITKVFG